ncbi:MAG: S8 family serine peptidase [Bdellovibrionales bacterium]|nr:S8 family serine peptidase [Bdellovibrionales bacterium]
MTASLFIVSTVRAENNVDYLIKLDDSTKGISELMKMIPQDSLVENLGGNWYRVQFSESKMNDFNYQTLSHKNSVNHIQKNYIIKPYSSPSLEAAREKALQMLELQQDIEGGFFPDPGNGGGKITDNPPFPSSGSGGSGPDPKFNQQWGMNQIGVVNAWQKTKGSPEMVVAVIDTGVDYTHEDLVDNIWRNPKETGLDANGKDKSTNGVDDDGNGFIDDVVGWDFAANDNKPYDLYSTFEQILTGQGNPGHGTHCAGNVGARADNGKGIVGVAPNIKIMAIRFISEKGQGTTADAIKAIRYAVDNGAKVLSNSWGSEGEDPKDPDNQALKDAISYAEAKGVLFIAAAGNGHQGVGYNNDTDRAPAYPSSYNNDIIVSVAAIDERNNLGSFSNWGLRSVDLAAPGVKVFSTVPNQRYQDTIGSFFGQQITWDGTSMATPHVAGAAALYWSAHPEKTWREVKQALLASVKKTQVLGNKVLSGGQLDVANLMLQP